MVSLKNRQSGFTIVELLIVIVIIGILATLVIVTFTGIQERARDSERQTDVNAIRSQVEAFYATQGFYPDATALNQAAFRSNPNFKFTLDASALRAPRGTADTVTATAPATGVVNTYYYETTGCTGTTLAALTASSTIANLAQCTGYTITANLESNTTAFVKKSN